MTDEIKKAREQGQNEAWKLIRKIIVCEDDGGYLGDMLKEVFGTVNYTEIFCGNTYAEAAEKIKKWKDEFHNDDIIEYRDTGCYGVITETKKETISGIREDGVPFTWCKGDCIKTGRTLPVKDWLRQIGGKR